MPAQLEIGRAHAWRVYVLNIADLTVALLRAKMLSVKDLSCLFQPTDNLRIHFYIKKSTKRLESHCKIP